MVLKSSLLLVAVMLVARALQAQGCLADWGFTSLECRHCLRANVLPGGRQDLVTFTAQPVIRGVVAGGPSEGKLINGDTLMAIDSYAITDRSAAVFLSYGRPTAVFTVMRSRTIRKVIITPTRDCSGEELEERREAARRIDSVVGVRPAYSLGNEAGDSRFSHTQLGFRARNERGQPIIGKVDSVLPASAAERANILPGDIVERAYVTGSRTTSVTPSRASGPVKPYLTQIQITTPESVGFVFVRAGVRYTREIVGMNPAGPPAISYFKPLLGPAASMPVSSFSNATPVTHRVAGATVEMHGAGSMAEDPKTGALTITVGGTTIIVRPGR